MPPPERPLGDGLHRKGDEQPAARWPVVAVALLGIVAVVLGVYATSGVGQVEDQKDAAVAEKIDLGRQVTEACAQGDVVQSPDGRDLCRRGAEAQSTPAPTVVEGLPGRPPTPQEISDAVAAYLAVHPPPAGRPPTTAEVAAAVAEYLTANPPQPGRPPTAAEISDAVATYFAVHPPPQGEPGADGKDGQDGKDGRPPTEEEISAAVATYLAEHPPDPGPTCPAGSTLQPVLFASGERGLGCVTEQAPPTTAPPTTDPSPTAVMVEPDDGELFGG